MLGEFKESGEERGIRIEGCGKEGRLEGVQREFYILYIIGVRKEGWCRRGRVGWAERQKERRRGGKGNFPPINLYNKIINKGHRGLNLSV